MMKQGGYYFFEAAHAILGPARAASDALGLFYRNPLNPLSQTAMGRSVSAACELFERTTRRYGKPHLRSADNGESRAKPTVNGISEHVVWKNTILQPVIHFERALPVNATPSSQSKLLIVAPMSGHFATLLRGTVEAFPARAIEVYITDWVDARLVPMSDGQASTSMITSITSRI